MAKPTTLKINADIPKNRLYITIAGNLAKEDYERLYSELKSLVPDLRPGFNVITDIRNCKMGHISGLSALQKIMNHLITQGVGEILRVVQTDSLIYRQAMNLASKTQGYRPIYVLSLDEAETFLEKAAKRNGLRFYLHQHEIIYMVEGQENKGRIVNISTSGCAIETEWREALLNREILLKVNFARKNHSPIFFEIPAQVVRVEDYTFAAKFFNFDSPEKEQLWECLLNEAQQLL